MKNFRILHLYSDLMNLYGDWANADILARALTVRGYSTVVDKKSVGDSVDFSAYNFAYIGSGTERSQRACMRDLVRHREALLGQIEAGLFMLATGNSHELFGRTVRAADGERFETLAFLDFETVQKKSRVTRDCIYTASFLQSKLIGFINRAGGGQEGDNAVSEQQNEEGNEPKENQQNLKLVERPFACVMGFGASDDSRYEGIRYKNLLGTYLTGPILVRNPPLLAYYVDLLIGTPQGAVENSPLFTRQEAAYQSALGELLTRADLSISI